MIILAATTDLIQIVSGSTSALKVQASWVDLSGTTVTPGRLNTAIASAATTTVVTSPASSTQRAVEFLSVYNGGAAETVTVQHTDGTTVVPLQSLTLNAGYTLVFEKGAGWQLRDASGNLQQSVGPGRFLKRTVILNGTTTFTTQPATGSILARLQAAGGAGGGGAAVAGECGSGGGSGSYAEWAVAVSPSTAYTVAVGAGGTGVSAGTGNTGGITTMAVGATTVTCNGGVGGVAGTSIAVPVLGGAGGAVSTNGTLNAPGDAGLPNVCIGTAADNASGAGGNSVFGNGGAAKLEASAAVGNAAGGYGAGGGGGSTTGTATLGGAGSNGVIIIDEYSA